MAMQGPTTSSMDHMESRVLSILIGTVVPAVVATIFVLARIYTRIFLVASWGWDDSWILVSWLSAIVLSTLNCVFIKFGAGHHADLQTIAEGIITIKLAYVTKIIYSLCLGTTKIGICAFYLRVFPEKPSRVFSFSMMGFIILFTLFFMSFTAVFCFPDPKKPFGKCIKNTPDLYVSAACNIFADILLLAFVLPKIVKLDMSRRTKFSLLAVMSTSILVIVAAFVRMFKVQSFNNSTDRTFAFSDITTWSAVEVQTGLFCASAPTIKPLLKKLFPRYFATLSTGDNTMSFYMKRPKISTRSQRTFQKHTGDVDVEMEPQPPREQTEIVLEGWEGRGASSSAKCWYEREGSQGGKDVNRSVKITDNWIVTEDYP